METEKQKTKKIPNDHKIVIRKEYLLIICNMFIANMNSNKQQQQQQTNTHTWVPDHIPDKIQRTKKENGMNE